MAREAGRDGRAGQLECRRIRMAARIGAGRHLDDCAGELTGDAVDIHGELLPDGEARRGDGAGRNLHDEAAAGRGLDHDKRAARRREIARLDEALGHTAGERRRHAGLLCDGGGCFHRAFALLDGALGLLVLHPGHVELERRGRVRRREGLVAFVVAFGEGEGRARLRGRALGLGLLALRRLRVDLDEDVAGLDGLADARGDGDDVRHDARGDGGGAIGGDGAVEGQAVGKGRALDNRRGSGHWEKRRRVLLRR